MIPERLSSRASLGAVLPALGPALQGYPVDRCLQSRGEDFYDAQEIPSQPLLASPKLQTRSLHLSRLFYEVVLDQLDAADLELSKS